MSNGIPEAIIGLVPKPVLEAYNAKVQNSLGDSFLADRKFLVHDDNRRVVQTDQDPWKKYFGVEFELEVDRDSESIKKLLSELTPAQQKALSSVDPYKNTWLCHLIAGRVIKHCAKYAIAKRDGSMAEGIEVVSLPMTLGMHHKGWGGFFASVRENGLVVKKTCGMHVHVSRELMTDLQIGRILSFMHNPANSKLITIIAGRCPPDKYASIKGVKKVSDVQKSSSQRYSAFNLTNTHTVEFRIFKGVDNEERFLVNLEFCAALVDFCRPCSCSVRELQARNFLTFVTENASMYRNLEAFLISKRLLKRRHKKFTKAMQKKYLQANNS